MFYVFCLFSAPLLAERHRRASDGCDNITISSAELILAPLQQRAFLLLFLTDTSRASVCDFFDTSWIMWANGLAILSANQSNPFPLAVQGPPLVKASPRSVDVTYEMISPLSGQPLFPAASLSSIASSAHAWLLVVAPHPALTPPSNPIFLTVSNSGESTLTFSLH